MKLYSKEDYHYISEEDKKTWKQLQKKEIVCHNDKPTPIRRSRYKEYPKPIRYFLSLFPNNFIDGVDLVESKKSLQIILDQFVSLIDATKTNERDILNFIKDKEAYFIIGSILIRNYCFGHQGLYLFPEFKMPPNYQADYLLVGRNSHGHHFVFVELESPHGRITKKDGTFGETIRKGIKQTDDWRIWLESNFSNLELVFEGSKKQDEPLPKEFRQFDKTRVQFVVVSGRRNNFNERTYRESREYFEQRKLRVIHYDNLVDYTNSVISTSNY